MAEPAPQASQQGLTLIAAVARNGVIGRDNTLPWHLPEDLAHFRQLTMGQAVIMGRNTWESLPAKFSPLPGRLNIVLTRQPDYLASGAMVLDSLEDALTASLMRTPFIIGGAHLYAAALPFAERLELTEIEAEIDGDVFFPARDQQQWRELARQPGVSKTGLRYSFVSYARITT